MPSTHRALNAQDLHLFHEGTHVRVSDILGVHTNEAGGCTFRVWAPRASGVSVIGTFNGWQDFAHPLTQVGNGIWEGSVQSARKGDRYKYRIWTGEGPTLDKADPVGFLHDQPPDNASVIWPLDFSWSDHTWMTHRASVDAFRAPMSIYEVHLGSWKKDAENQTYADLANSLVAYVKKMGFTHVEFMPVMEHPFYGSWGYQTTGYFAPTSRYGEPQDLMRLIDTFHQAGIGVILDWVPSHFPSDAHALGNFDNLHEYEHADPRRGFHPDWNSFIFNYGRGPVRSFLVSSALFWLEHYHADCLRVDGVASMLYLDYSRKPGEWISNEYGGRENLDAIGFLRRLNEQVYASYPSAHTMAEESTAWPMVSRPTYLGGLGFGFKWDLGWAHDTLQYFARDPIHRKFHHHEITFRMQYAFNENFILPISHDEVVYGKRSLLSKMPGDDTSKFANTRAFLAYMYAQPGKKLLFMGSEFGQWEEWGHDRGLDWAVSDLPPHAALRLLVGDLNHLYRSESALHELDHAPEGFQWIEADDAERNVVVFERRDTHGRVALVVCNFSGVPHQNYRLGVNTSAAWLEILNTDAVQYGGKGNGNFGEVHAVPIPLHGRPYSVTIDIPALSVLYLRAA
jgi:1,4-alpha-glucan branching enzyme